MQLKRYTLAALILMVGVAWLVFAMVTHESFAINLFGIEIPSLPVAAWVVIPMLIMYLASLLHMMYYSLKAFFHEKQYEKDYKKLAGVIYNSFLGQDSYVEFSTQRYKNLFQLIKNTNLTPKDSLFVSYDDQINKALEVINKVNNGEHVDLKRFSLPTDNVIYEKNILNGIKTHNMRIVEDILNNKDNYSESLFNSAIDEFVVLANYDQIKKYGHLIDFENLQIVIQRSNNDEDSLKLTSQEIFDLVKVINLKAKEYLAFAKLIRNSFLPDDKLKFFEELFNINEASKEAYIYTLLDLEMLSKAYEILDNAESNECMSIRAYLDLKENNKNYELDLFF